MFPFLSDHLQVSGRVQGSDFCGGGPWDSLDDIWDAPIAPRTPNHSRNDSDSGPRPSKRRRASLFLPGSDEDEDNGVSHPAPLPSDKINALFDDDFTFEPLRPAIDVEALRRQAEARHTKNAPSLTPHAILPSSSPPRDVNGAGAKEKDDNKTGKDEKKPRKKVMKLDEGRLLGSNGFPMLIQSTKHFKPKGKGHEVTELNRLLQVYQFWTHKLYPKTQFRDTVERVEKLCHSRRMNVSLSVWRDEAHGLVNGRKPDDADTTEESPNPTDDPSDSDETGYASSSSAASTQPPSSGSASEIGAGGDDDDDFDLDALIREEQARAQDSAPNEVTYSYRNKGGGGGKGRRRVLCRDGRGRIRERGSVLCSSCVIYSEHSSPPVDSVDIDGDMWDGVQDIENKARTASSAPGVQDAAEPPGTSEGVMTEEEELEDVYI